ncbi:MAG TPA: LysM domain-containing protein [Chloroflexota bacterium]|nr:LysM domain-containing protein [Chloroflexota bacterium]HUM69493.1 LysM domain-containing protein [Chloroflexota bacterium]
MRKPAIVVISLLAMALLIAACGQIGGGGSSQTTDPELVVEVIPPTPTNTATPTPTLPATFTPIAMGYGGSLYIIGGTRSVHIVQAGETLGILAKQYGVTVDAIAKANRISNYNLIKVGQVLYIPPCE